MEITNFIYITCQIAVAVIYRVIMASDGSNIIIRKRCVWLLQSSDSDSDDAEDIEIKRHDLSAKAYA